MKGLFQGAVVVAVIVGCFLFTGVWLVWILIARPFAVSRGMIPPTAYDHVVRGWKAERQGRWDVALAEYDEALDLNPRHPDAHARRDALLAAHPELAERTEPPRKPSRG